MHVLGIETSCDETGIAIYDGQKGLRSNILHSQAELHALYGGVVPELASRDHIRRVTPLLQQALRQANLKIEDIDGIAYTAGPGLFVTLLVGATLARTLAWAIKKPAIGVHHMEAHLLAALLEDNKPQFPFLGLLISGGHTLLVKVTALGVYEILGDTRDDAVGEAFDKVAKVLGLSYPGGPQLAKLAEQGNPSRFHFPRPMLNQPGLDFSFSGLKTCAINTLQKHGAQGSTPADIARAFEDAVVDTLITKVKRAINFTNIQQVVVAGGVGANKKLRILLQETLKTLDVQVFYPRIEFCTDNGAMVAFAGYLRLNQGESEDLAIKIKPRWQIDAL